MREQGPDLQYLPNLHWLQQKKLKIKQLGVEERKSWRERKKKKKKEDILAAVSVCKS